MNNDTDKLLRYIDGELSEAEVLEVETRLKTDEAYQAEHLAVKRIDQLLLEAPLVEPSTDFVARFETRLEQRLKWRRNLIGASMISLVLVLATGLLFWSFASSGLSLLGWLNGVNVLDYVVDLLQGVLTSFGIVFRVVTLMTEIVFQLIKHPIFWGYMLLAAGLVSLWAQVLKWVGFVRPSARA
jgi:hypothetical protein